MALHRNRSRIASVAISFTLIIIPAAESGQRMVGSTFSPRPVETSRLRSEDARRLGWDASSLDRVFDHVARLSSDSFVIVTDGAVVGSMGKLDTVYPIHSMRKAMLSTIVGQHIGDGLRQIPLSATLAQLGIDDEPQPLSAAQRQARVQDLLKSMSGINHPAAADGGLRTDTNRRLGHGENRPGTIWAYNNWDYNALTTIFEQRTGLSVCEAFQRGVAVPTGMQDFGPDAVEYASEPERSLHRAASFRMSSRDLVRIGQLFLDDGKADGQPVLPPSWIEGITRDDANTGFGGLRAGHGYLWWVPAPSTGLPKGSFLAWGLGQQALFVIPAWNTVIVHQADMTAFVGRWIALQREGVDGDTALERILESCIMPGKNTDKFCIEDRFISRREFDRLVTLIVAARRNGERR